MEAPTERVEARSHLEVWKKQQRDHGRLCYGPTTAEILGDGPDDYPPTLNEVGFANQPWLRQPHLSRLLDKILDFSMTLSTAIAPPAWTVSKDFATMALLLQFNDELPATVTADHHAYFITTFHRTWPTSFRHWSFYTQGHFFHLSAPRLDKNPTRQGDSSGVASQRIPVRLKHEDFSTPDTTDSINYRNSPSRIALLAYQVGKTQYTPDKLLKLAKWIIEQVRTYDILEVNCQMFVLSMMYRTIMTSRDCSVFTGTAPQIAYWDLHGRASDECFYDYDHGYLLAAPRPRISRSLLDVPPFANLRFRMVWSAHRISKLYQDGPQGHPSFDPEGKRGVFRYVAHTGLSDINESWLWGKRLMTEFVEDVKQGRWKDAFVGRLDTRLEQYADSKKKAEERGGRYESYLRQDRSLLCIPREQW